MTTVARYILPAWLAHAIVNDFLIFSIQAGGELGLTGVSESLSSLFCHGVCVCVCVCASVCAHCKTALLR